LTRVKNCYTVTDRIAHSHVAVGDFFLNHKLLTYLMKKTYALISVFDKTGIEGFAAALVARGFSILSTGGTSKYLKASGFDVTDVSEITGYDPVLDHRVVTLAPQIHGGLLADNSMLEELAELDWPEIGFARVDFYPLEDELRKKEATLASCIKSTDIGGPAMIRSANKGGRAIPVVSQDQEQNVIAWLEAGRPDEEAYLFDLRRVAERAVSDYCLLSASVYDRFAPATKAA
jgi:AICAR transformylase/IMP cyclohydrolase PurH